MSLDALLSLEGIILYPMLFFALLGGAIGLPIPEDLPLIAAGIFGQRGSGNLGMLFVVCYLGVVMGDTIIFLIGRRFGAALFTKKWFRRKFSPRRLKRFKLGLERRRLATIFIARHLFYLRMVTFLACGAVKMPLSRFLVSDMIAALVSVPAMMCVGYFASENYEVLLNNVEFVFGILAIAIAAYFLQAYLRGKSKATRSSE
ncbi:MAG: DedA family protein [Bdellovibrionales bacterium]|nr:DedA family protein [Bdellovibrionales bacterium]